MEERLKTHSDNIEQKFDDHTACEMDRYNEILALIAQSNTDHNDRHRSLLVSVEAHMNRTELIYSNIIDAFPSDKHGKPDFHGHARAHETWVENAAATRDLLTYIKKSVFAAGCVAAGSWIVILLWQGVLHGPAK